jgi:hypothetical protein
MKYAVIENPSSADWEIAGIFTTEQEAWDWVEKEVANRVGDDGAVVMEASVREMDEFEIRIAEQQGR